MEQIKYCHLIAGNLGHFQTVLQAINEEIRPALDKLGWEEDSEKFNEIRALNIRRSPTMDAFATAAIVFGTYILTKLSDKIFDTVYTETIRQPLENAIRKILNGVRSARKQPVIYHYIVHLSDMDMSVLIRLILNDENEVETSFDDIDKAYKNACAWILANGKKAAIHCYTIENKKCSPAPSFFNSIEEIIPR